MGRGRVAQLASIDGPKGGDRQHGHCVKRALDFPRDRACRIVAVAHLGVHSHPHHKHTVVVRPEVYHREQRRGLTGMFQEELRNPVLL